MVFIIKLFGYIIINVEFDIFILIYGVVLKILRVVYFLVNREEF